MQNIKLAEWGEFYKYGTFKNIERIRPMLCENTFYFPTPSQLNDPSDCKNIIENHSAEEIEEYLITANQQFYGHSRGNSYIKKAIKQFGAEVILEEMAKTFNELMDTRYGIFSLAKRYDNMSLWAKYADNHEGYCLEFSNLSTFSHVFEVEYKDKIPFNLCSTIDRSQADFLYTKSVEWSNEEEARIISKPSGAQGFPKGALKGFIIGEQASSRNVEMICSWVQECNPELQVKKAQFNTAKQKLEFLTIACSKI